MNIFKKSLIGLSLVALLASCSAGTTTKSAMADKSTASEKNNTTEVQPVGTVVPQEKIDRELLSIVEVKLVNGKVELSQSEVESGELEFNIRNEMAEPLNVSVVKTTLMPNELKVVDGKVDAAQKGVEVVSELHTSPIKANQEETIMKTLEPGDYQLVVTSPDSTVPVADAMLMLKAM